MKRKSVSFSDAEMGSLVQKNARESGMFSEELINDSSIEQLRTIMKVEAGYKTALANRWTEENLSALYKKNPSEFKYAFRNLGVLRAIQRGEYNLADESLTPTALIKHAADNSKKIAKEIVDNMTPDLNIPIGVEIESYMREGQQRPLLLDGWTCVPDDSLTFDSDDSSVDSQYLSKLPGEFVSPVLKNMDDINSLVDFAALVDKNCVASKTKEDSKQKSGLHVHIGIFEKAMKFNMYECDELPELPRIKQILLVYSALEEKWLDFLQRKYKMGNLHKAWEFNAVERANRVAEAEADTKNNPQNAVWNAHNINNCQKDQQASIELQILSAKYVCRLESECMMENRETSGVNLESLMKHGTIEFRGHGGTVNPKEIAAWVSTINSVVGIADEILTQNNGNARLLNDDEKQQVAEVLKDLHENDSQLKKPKNLPPSNAESKKKRPHSEIARTPTNWEQLAASRQDNSSSPRR